MLLFLGCQPGVPGGKEDEIIFSRPGYDFPYHLASPARTWKLPPELMEISGLAYTPDDKLACVQDEMGTIYLFNPESGTVESKIDFGGGGDYEGIEIVGGDAWVLKSNGILYEVSGYTLGEPEVRKHKTALSGKNDAEGLGYDPAGNSLLIACKEIPYIDQKIGDQFRAIYRFDLETRQLDPEPILLIDLDTIRHHKNTEAGAGLGGKLQGMLDPSKGGSIFKPSGIAVHPLTGDWYILGSVGKLLLVFSREGMLLAIVNLNPVAFPQPEGICFSPYGTLYISNEGQGQRGTIARFKPQHD